MVAGIAIAGNSEGRREINRLPLFHSATADDMRADAANEAMNKAEAPNSAIMRLPGSNTVLQGAMVYSDRWAATDADGKYLYPVEPGIYTLEAKAEGKTARVQTIQDLAYMYAGVSTPGGLYYAILAEGTETKFYFSTYTTSNWSRRSKEEIDIVNMPSDLTYDPVTKKVYGFFFNEETQDYDRFCSFSTTTAEAKDIALMERHCSAIAANAKGEIYCIWGYTGWLYKVDAKTGKQEPIGRTGIYPGDDCNTLTFDDATGKLYWIASAERKNDGTVERQAGLYEVDTTSGKATLVRAFPDNDSFAGVYALPYSVPADAPGEATDVAVEFATPGATEGVVSFTAPQLTVGGSPISGTLDFLVEANGMEKVVEGIAPGAKASASFTFAEGAISGRVTACNATTRGASVEFSSWAGVDLPGAPEELVLAEQGGKPHLSWKAPARGANGGAIDASSLSYRIVRNSDKKEVANGLKATEWTDETFSGTAALSYSVYAVNSKGESVAAISQKVIFGEGFTLPFCEGFDTADAFDLWTVEDLNGFTKWEYSASKKNIYQKYDNNNSPADDWIFSPKFSLTAGKTYCLEFDANTSYDTNAKYAEDFEFWLSKAPSHSGKKQKIGEWKKFLSKAVKHQRVIFKAEEGGVYHLGLYTNSAGTHWQLNIDNIALAEVDSHVPAAVSDLKVEAGENGALSAKLSFAAPTKDADGNTLTEKMSVSVTREGETAAAKEFAEVSPGEKLEWTDTPSASGMKTWKVVASTIAGEGAEASVSAFIGVDTPGAPQNLKATETASGVNLAWDAPREGTHGGWFDASAVTYRIVRSDGKVLAEAHAATTFSDETLKLTKQELLYYLVTPYVGTAKGSYANTPFDVYGPAYKAPIAETFPGADMRWYPWVAESDGPTQTWVLETAGTNPQTPDQNGDGGLAMMIANEQTKGITGTFASPKFDVSALAEKELSFMMYHSSAADASANEPLDVYFKETGGEWTKLNDAPILRDNGTQGWQRHSFLLPAKGEVRVMFKCKSLGGANVYIDNVRIDEPRNFDLEAVSISTAKRVARATAIPVRLAVANNGADDLAGVKLTVEAFGTKVGEKTLTMLKGGESTEITLDIVFPQSGKTTLKLTAEHASDKFTDNNTAECSVEAVEGTVPGIGNLEGTFDASEGKRTVNLTWRKPAETANVTDDFESYEDWAITGVGDWTNVDRDLDVTASIKKDLESYPNMNAPKAFQVCNANTLGIDIWPQGTPHSGKKMMMAIANINRGNDDWLISPMLNGNAQTISFYAKAFTTQDTNPEKMAVYYSRGSLNPDDFVKISAGETLTVPDSWNEYRYQLPEGARYFAIRCLSEDAFALFVDDATFDDLTVLPLKVDKFEIYRDGTKIGETTDGNFSDDVATVGGGEHEYMVKACYPDGQTSMQSVKVDIAEGGIAGVADGTTRISTDDEGILISAPEGEAVQIFGIDGRVIYRGVTGADTLRVAASRGVYIVCVGTRSYKLRL